MLWVFNKPSVPFSLPWEQIWEGLCPVLCLWQRSVWPTDWRVLLCPRPLRTCLSARYQSRTRSPHQQVTHSKHPANNTQCQTLFTATFPWAFADNAAVWGARPLSLPAPSPSLILPTSPCHRPCQGTGFSGKLRGLCQDRVFGWNW